LDHGGKKEREDMNDRGFRRTIFRWRFFWLALGLLCIPALTAAQSPDSTNPNDAEGAPASVTIAALGVAEIRDQNTAEARQRATRNGLEGAVLQAASRLVGAERIGADLSPFLSTISGQAENFVENYRVLGTAPTGNQFRVLVEATVSAETLRTRLARFTAPPAAAAADSEDPGFETGGGPRVLILMAHQDLEDISPEFWWGEGPGPETIPAETALAEVLTEAGLSIVTHGNQVPNVAVQGAIIFQPDLNNQEALSIAESYDADLVVVGKAIVYRVPETAGEARPSFNATVTARALRVDTKESLGSVLETVVRVAADAGAEGEEALAAAGRLAGEKLAEPLASVSIAPGNPERDATEPVRAGELEIVVNGAGNLGNFVQFRRKLTAVEGVSGLQIRRMQDDEATLAVTYPGGADALARALSEESFQLFSLSVQSPDPDRLRVTLTPR
jgi:hypothetical protein